MHLPPLNLETIQAILRGELPDETVKPSCSIAPENKQSPKQVLGFATGLIHELTPQRTRRATAANWLLGVLLAQSQLA
ncbi:MAG: DUF1823 family protein [Thermostichus sp. DG_1_6_bins_120]